jgi:hypothetical protein
MHCLCGGWIDKCDKCGAVGCIICQMFEGYCYYCHKGICYKEIRGKQFKNERDDIK